MESCPSCWSLQDLHWPHRQVWQFCWANLKTSMGMRTRLWPFLIFLWGVDLILENLVSYFLGGTSFPSGNGLTPTFQTLHNHQNISTLHWFSIFVTCTQHTTQGVMSQFWSLQHLNWPHRQPQQFCWANLKNHWQIGQNYGLFDFFVWGVDLILENLVSIFLGGNSFP